MKFKELFRKYDIHPKKSLGQNFLTALPTLKKIVRSLQATQDDKVLEIGPGIGVMTKLLTETSKFVTVIEADKKMVHLLETELGDIANLHIIHGDILDTNLDKLLGETGQWLFVGNIPYNITSPILFHIRKYRKKLRYGLLTLQKEVVDRLIAVPGNKEYGILSIAFQAIGQVEKCFEISSSSFYPEPRVDSAVVRISFEKRPAYDIVDLDFFTNVVRAAFSTRRKKIKNALMQSHFLDIPSEKITESLQALSLENERAEELPIRTFADLARRLKGE